VTGEYEPDSAKGLDLVEDIRSDVHAIDGADAEVGGAAATELDARDGNRADFFTIVPMVLAISFIILLGILRSPVAAATLVLVNVWSSTAAIGLSAFMSRASFDESARDAQVRILAFLFLVALGIDYSIFLAYRAKKESVVHGGRQGMVEAVAHTGGVITSAGIVLAGVFAALGMLPLMVLGQLGLIVGVGVLVDTIIVRTVIVPSIFGLAGNAVWWPNRAITHRSGEDSEPARQPEEKGRQQGESMHLLAEKSTQAADRIAAGTEPEVIAVGGPVGGQARRRTCPGTGGPAGTSTSA